ncbi:MAG: hypothetical protein HY049_10385 [Acidobacteria bacterium]|nr:hypothetical protein [Acidobacteriota bacterium]
MKDTTNLIGIALTLAIAVAVTAYLRRSLVAVLTDLCGTRERAEFWAGFSAVVLVLAPMIFALYINPSPDGAVHFADIAALIQRGLIGLVSALAIIGLTLGHFIGSRNGTC